MDKYFPGTLRGEEKQQRRTEDITDLRHGELLVEIKSDDNQKPDTGAMGREVTPTATTMMDALQAGHSQTCSDVVASSTTHVAQPLMEEVQKVIRPSTATATVQHGLG